MHPFVVAFNCAIISPLGATTMNFRYFESAGILTWLSIRCSPCCRYDIWFKNNIKVRRIFQHLHANAGKQMDRLDRWKRRLPNLFENRELILNSIFFAELSYTLYSGCGNFKRLIKRLMLRTFQSLTTSPSRPNTVVRLRYVPATLHLWHNQTQHKHHNLSQFR